MIEKGNKPMKAALLTLSFATLSTGAHGNGSICLEEFLSSVCTAEFAPVECVYQTDRKTYSVRGSNKCHALVSLKYQTCVDEVPFDSSKIVCHATSDDEFTK